MGPSANRKRRGVAGLAAEGEQADDDGDSADDEYRDGGGEEESPTLFLGVVFVDLPEPGWVVGDTFFFIDDFREGAVA